MERIIEYYQTSYYTGLVCAFLAVIGVIILSTKKMDNTKLRLFKLYFLGYLFLTALTILAKYYPYYTTPGKIFDTLHHHCDYYFTVFEFFVFANILKEMANEKVFIGCTVILITSAIFFYFQIISSKRLIDYAAIFNLFTIQAFCLLAICTSFYFETFKKNNKTNLKDKPTFLISIGLSLCLICILPLSLFSNHLFFNNVVGLSNLFGIVYISYSILFIIIIKAILMANNNRNFQLSV